MGLAEDFENSRIERYKKQFNTEERRMFLFKCFVSFLELWGEENYGNSSIVDWVKVHNYVCDSNIITSSIEIDNLVYGDLDPESDEFRDKVYKFIEDHVIEDVSMHTFFKLSPWLKRKLDEEIKNKIRKECEEIFNKSKCLRCKHYIDHITIFDAKTLNRYSVEDYIRFHPGEEITHNMIQHHRNCDLRKKLIEFFLTNMCPHDAMGNPCTSFKRHSYTKSERGFAPTTEDFNNWLGIEGDLDAMKFFTYKEINERDSAAYGPKDITDKWVMNDKVMKKTCSGFVPSDKVKNYDDYVKLYYNI